MKRILVALAMTFTALNVPADDWQPLWPGDAPGAPKPAAGSETRTKDGHCSNIETPMYRLYKPATPAPGRPAVVVLPGGGYTIVAMGHEGEQIGEWLSSNGVAAVVVKYRVSGDDKMGYGWPVPLLDARQAIRLARTRAAEFGIATNHIGVMGFSAGGHLASMCATLWNKPLAGVGDGKADPLARPDFCALVYPVIAMNQFFGHSGSKRRLLGAKPNDTLLRLASTQEQVDRDTPPVFLVHTEDDPVPCLNSISFFEACKSNNVPAELHLFPKGGHGYGLRATSAVKAWPDLMLKWMHDQQFIQP